MCILNEDQRGVLKEDLSMAFTNLQYLPRMLTYNIGDLKVK